LTYVGVDHRPSWPSAGNCPGDQLGFGPPGLERSIDGVPLDEVCFGSGSAVEKLRALPIRVAPPGLSAIVAYAGRLRPESDGRSSEFGQPMVAASPDIGGMIQST